MTPLEQALAIIDDEIEKAVARSKDNSMGRAYKIEWWARTISLRELRARIAREVSR